MTTTSKTDHIKIMRSDVSEIKGKLTMVDLRLRSMESQFKVIKTDLSDLHNKFDSLDEKIFEWKSQLFDKIDSFLSRIDGQDKEISALSNRSSDHSDRLEKLEKIHPKSKHAFA